MFQITKCQLSTCETYKVLLLSVINDQGFDSYVLKILTINYIEIPYFVRVSPVCLSSVFLNYMYSRPEYGEKIN